MSLWWACIKRIDSKPSRTHSIDWLTQLTRLTYSTHFWNRSRAFRSPSSLCFSRMVLLDSIDSIKLNFSYKVHRMKNEWILEIRSLFISCSCAWRLPPIIKEDVNLCYFFYFQDLLLHMPSVPSVPFSAVQCRIPTIRHKRMNECITTTSREEHNKVIVKIERQERQTH